jgi:serine protease Do
VRDGRRQTLQITVATLELDEDQTATSGPPDTGFGMSLGGVTPDLSNRLKLPEGRDGVLVSSIQPGGSAARAGIRAGDIIVEVNREPVSTAADAANRLQSVTKGATAFVLVWRDGQELFLTLTRG